MAGASRSSAVRESGVLRAALCQEGQQQPKRVAIGRHRMMHGVLLLDETFAEES